MKNIKGSRDGYWEMRDAMEEDEKLVYEEEHKYAPNNSNERVLKLIKERLELGQQKYKQDIPLKGEGGRDNLKESLEEILDLIVYIAATILELRDKRFYNQAHYKEEKSGKHSFSNDKIY